MHLSNEGVHETMKTIYEWYDTFQLPSIIAVTLHLQSFMQLDLCSKWYTPNHFYTACTSKYLKPEYVGVLDRDRIIFRHVFRAHHRVWCTITPSFCRGWGSYMLNRCIRYSCICTLRMSPTLSGSLARKCVKLSDALEIHNGMISNFYLGLPHMVFRNMESKQSIQYLMWTP